MNPILVKKMREGAKLPTYGSAGAAGADLYACLETAVTVVPGGDAWIPTGLSMEIPRGWAGLVYARSSLGTKRGLAPANKVGVIDSDYRGEIMVVLHNHGSAPQTISPGDRIAQLVLTPVLTPEYQWSEALAQSDRGTGGFGSTGK